MPIDLKFTNRITQVLLDKKMTQLGVVTCCTKNRTYRFDLVDMTSFQTTNSKIFDINMQNFVVKAFDNHRIVATNFSNQNNPNIVDLVVYSFTAPEPILHWPNCQVKHANIDYVILHHPTIQDAFITLSTTTGQQVDQLPTISNIEEGLKFANTYGEGSEYFAWFQRLLTKESIAPIHSIEYIKAHDALILGIYAKQNDSIVHQLMLYDTSANLKHCEIIGTDIRSFTRDTFFISKEYLIVCAYDRVLLFNLRLI